MNRSTFITAASAAALIAPAAWAGSKTIDYTPGPVDAALKEGKTVFIDYAADWCSTCHRQERVINALREANQTKAIALLQKNLGEADSAVFDFTLANLYLQSEELDRALGVHRLAHAQGQLRLRDQVHLRAAQGRYEQEHRGRLARDDGARRALAVDLLLELGELDEVEGDRQLRAALAEL